MYVAISIAQATSPCPSVKWRRKVLNVGDKLDILKLMKQDLLITERYGI